jgi:predicted P-loop ATPase/GTPase
MNTFDSGKTQVAIMMSKALVESGYSVEYFKPQSGHNYWYHYEHTKSCLERGSLVSMDALRVRKYLEPRSSIELANPVHALFVPMRLEKPMQTMTNTLGLAGESSVLTMKRFSWPVESGVDTTVLVAEKLIEDERLIINQEEVGMLSRGAAIQSVDSFEEIQEYEHLNFEKHVSDSFAAVERLADITIIEGFNNAAWPWDGLDRTDVVLLVGPAHIFSYDPERFRKAAYLMKRGDLPISEVTFGRISDLLKPLARIQIRPESHLTMEQFEHLGALFRTGKKD